MHIFHCWHKVDDVPGYRIRIRYRCKEKDNQHYYIRQTNSEYPSRYTLCIAMFRCCICGIERMRKYRDWDPDRTMKEYPDSSFLDEKILKCKDLRHLAAMPD
jgi:hypothetical protein